MKTRGKVDFSKTLRVWDGFGINYVEAGQTRDYKKWPQNYGSFELLTEEDRQKILELIFGDDGLKPNIGKMFINPLHAGMQKPEEINADPNILDMKIYDHETTTRWMRYFIREGLKRIRERNESFNIICTLYCPAPWMTMQKIIRGRDLDLKEKYEIAKYIIAFAKYLKEIEGFPIKYLSLHNEGGSEEYARWPEDGGDGIDYLGRDYNAIWPEAVVVEFLDLMGEMLKRFNMADIGVTNGECTFLKHTTKYIEAIVKDEKAISNFALMTSHGFTAKTDLTADWAFTSAPIDVIRQIKPDFHGWVTSATWGKMGTDFVTTIHRHIYESKINGYIPWAAIQRHSQWTGGDPNPGTAILVTDDGKWSIQRGYYLYKHYCPVGRTGMGVAQTESDIEGVFISAFSSNGTKNPDAIVIINDGNNTENMMLEVEGSKYSSFSYVITDDNRTYEKGSEVVLHEATISMMLPPKSVITLQGIV